MNKNSEVHVNYVMYDLRFVSIAKPSRPPRHKWNIVESGVKHHKSICVLWVSILELFWQWGIFLFLHFIIASISVLMLIIKRKLKQWWSTIASLSIKPTIISHIKLLNTKIDHDIWHWKYWSWIWMTQKTGGVKPTYGIPRLVD